MGEGMKDKEAQEMHKIIVNMISMIDQSCYEVSEKLGQEAAERAFNAVVFAMLTRICGGLAENRGQGAFKNYWEQITELMNKLVDHIDCQQTRH